MENAFLTADEDGKNVYYALCLLRLALTIRYDKNAEVGRGMILLLVIISVIFTGCSAIEEEPGVEQRQETEQYPAAEQETTAVEHGCPAEIMVELPAELTNVEQLAFVGEDPCILADGTAYLYADGKWTAYAEEERLERLYTGDDFCALTEDGHLVIDAEALENYEEYPLGSAGRYDNVARMLEELQDREVTIVNGNIFGQSAICLLSDGDLRVFYAGKSFPITPPAAVAELSGNYLLTEAGGVYEIHFDEAVEKVNIVSVPGEGITAVSVCATASRCAGIREDGTVELWSDVGGELAGDFRNVEMVRMGFQYCAALDQEGKVLFSSYDKGQETCVRQLLEKQDRRAVMIDCNYRRIAVLYEDSQMVLFDF